MRKTMGKSPYRWLTAIPTIVCVIVGVPQGLALESFPVSIRIEVDSDLGPVRYLRVRAGNFGLLPDWHAGAGEAAWLFVDEVVVE